MNAEEQTDAYGGNPLLRRLLSLSMGLLLLTAMIWVFPLVSDIATMVIVSAVIAYALRPLMTYLERRGIDRIITILIAFLLFTSLLTMGIVFLVPQMIDQLSDFGRTLNQLDITKIREDTLEWVRQYAPQVAAVFEKEMSGTASMLGELLTFVTLLTIMPVLIFFMLKDGRKFTQTVVSKVPNRYFEMTLSLIGKINRTIGDYIVSVVISSLFIGVLTWVGLIIIDVKFALTLGVVSALFNIIPFFGPLLTMVVVFVVVLLTESALFWPLIWTAVLMFTLQQVESFVVKPALLSHSLAIHPAVVILVVLIGGRIAGAIGMFIAIPVYSILHMFITDLYVHLKNYRII